MYTLDLVYVHGGRRVRLAAAVDKANLAALKASFRRSQHAVAAGHANLSIRRLP